MSPPRHVRTSSHGPRVLPAHARPSKPAPVKTSKATSLTTKSGPGWSKSVGKRESIARSSEDEDDMAGLPSFCAFCEKQILTPNTTVLYCSAKCRRQDGDKPVTAAKPGTPEQSPRHFSISSEPRDYHDLLPQRSPTTRPSSSFYPHATSFYDIETTTSKTETEAARFLAQFKSGSMSPESYRRPQFERSRTSSHTNMPSLSHTPGSLTSPSSSYTSLKHLPCRTNPYGPPMSSKSIDLVVPITSSSSLNNNQASLHSNVSTVTAFPIAEGEMSYEKKTVASQLSPSRGSLQQLFSHDAIRRGPETSHKKF